MEATFNDKRMFEALSRMRADQQLAFGAMCCERMLPNYERFSNEEAWEDAGALRHALDVTWQACQGHHPGEEELLEMVSQCERCAPDSEDYTSLDTSFAQDAVFSVCAILDFLISGDVGRIVSVPRFATDSVDLFVQEQEGMDPRDSLREQKILEHRLMQQELMRQQRDLAAANSLAPGDGAALAALRARASKESSLLDAS